MNLRYNSSRCLTYVVLGLTFAIILVHEHGISHASSDKDSLLAFRSKISKDPNGIMISWNASINYCNWTGVTCSRRHHGRVTELDLQSQKLEGTLSPHVGNLSFLKTLYLPNNNFGLDIPQELGALFRLQILFLENNSFSGEIPINLSGCSNLYYLSLNRNQLVGKLPTQLGILSKVQYLDLGSNNFVGKIPPSYGNLSSAWYINLDDNRLHGSIPSTFGQLRSLEVLSFALNNFTGPYPSSISNLSLLTQLWLGGNKLDGSVPYDVGRTLPKLEILSLALNQFNGHIPTSIANLTSLQMFDISTQGITGKVPYLGALRNLRNLDLSRNSLGNEGNDDLSFMSSLLNCTSLEGLALSDNKFGGVLPELISNFSTKMKGLYLGRNQIRGNIPCEIGNLINLEVLSMEGNLLTGTIPSSIGKLQNLGVLSVGNNKLYGKIPSSIGNLSSILQLFFGLNTLQGSIPPSIGECYNLLRLSFSQNNLSGSIPQELFSVSSYISINLSRNMLTGSLPLEVGKQTSLYVLDISENNLSGEIPQTLSTCTSLEYLHLRGNSFHGELPSSLATLRGLQYLDLSRNNFSGRVPNYLENFALFYLNLSWNDFEGQLPVQRVFSNLTAISVMGNEKLCGGILELHLPSCTSENSKPSRLKLIVSLISAIVGVVFVLFFIFFYMSRKRTRPSTKSSSSMATFIQKVSYDDLRKATNGFSSCNLIGVGGFGSVYKGILGQERSVVAIKVLNLAKKGATKSFITECEALRSMRHRNLLKIITACSSVDFKGNDFKALVYEFVSNGSLEDWLHSIITSESDEQQKLNFVQRVSIVADVANALDYIHNEGQTSIIHCDLKPSNILIHQDMVAKVGDFGLARLCSEASYQFSSTPSSSVGIKGSIGYAAPEYGIGSEVSTAGDVYSFGIVLLEIFTGKRPTDSMFNDGLNLHSFANMALPGRVMLIADPTQFQSGDQFRNDKFWDCFISLIKLGIACSVEPPRERMNIKKVVEELVHIKDSLLRTGYILPFHDNEVEDKVL